LQPALPETTPFRLVGACSDGSKTKRAETQMAAEADSMLADDHIASWHDFYVAQVGASAAVAGLLVVAISINLEAILKKAWLIDRAAYSLTLIVGAFFITSYRATSWPRISRQCRDHLQKSTRARYVPTSWR
jgi:hypothetical protein